MSMPGVPAGGFRTISQIVPTNDLQFRPDQDCMTVATTLLSTHATGGPVVEGGGRYIGFLSEIDLLKALCAGVDLQSVRAEQLMIPCPIGVREETTIPEAIQVMDELHLHVLPVRRADGEVAYSITRHDLLRAWVGLGVGVEDYGG
jgi:predicted transcriptional regulator